MTDFTLGPGPLTPEFEQVKSDIGIVENGNTATHAIPAGYYVIWKGDLYVAKTDISSGTTLSAASGGNLTAKTSGIGAEVAALNSKITNLQICSEMPDGDPTDISSFKSKLSTLISSMSQNQNLPITFNPLFTSDGFTASRRIYGTLTKRNNTYFTFTGVSITGESIQIGCANGQWTINNINSNKAKKPIITEFTGTTSSSGALLIPTVVVSGTFLSAWGTNTAYFIYRRDNAYFMVRDTNLNVVSETEITIKVAYIPA